MKAIVIWFATAVAVGSAVKQDIFLLSKERTDNMLNKIAKPCAEEFNVDPDLVKNIADGTLPQDEATNKFVHCFGIKGGFTDKEGRMSIDRLAGIVGDHPRLEELKESVRKCNQLKGEDPVATIALIAPCIAHNMPINFQFQ